MPPRDLRDLGPGRLAPLQVGKRGRGERCFYGPQAIRPFRVPGPGIMIEKDRVSVVKRGHLA